MNVTSIMYKTSYKKHKTNYSLLIGGGDMDDEMPELEPSTRYIPEGDTDDEMPELEPSTRYIPEGDTDDEMPESEPSRQSILSGKTEQILRLIDNHSHTNKYFTTDFFEVIDGKRSHYLQYYDTQTVIGCHLTAAELWGKLCGKCTYTNIYHHFIDPGGFTRNKNVHPEQVIPELKVQEGKYLVWSCRILINSDASHIFTFIIKNDNSCLYYATYSSEIGEVDINFDGIRAFLGDSVYRDNEYHSVCELLNYIKTNRFIVTMADLNHLWTCAFGVSCLNKRQSSNSLYVGVTHTVDYVAIPAVNKFLTEKVTHTQ
jgi:hypothetical protein